MLYFFFLIGFVAGIIFAAWRSREFRQWLKVLFAQVKARIMDLISQGTSGKNRSATEAQRAAQKKGADTQAMLHDTPDAAHTAQGMQAAPMHDDTRLKQMAELPQLLTGYGEQLTRLEQQLTALSQRIDKLAEAQGETKRELITLQKQINTLTAEHPLKAAAAATPASREQWYAYNATLRQPAGFARNDFTNEAGNAPFCINLSPQTGEGNFTLTDNAEARMRLGASSTYYDKLVEARDLTTDRTLREVRVVSPGLVRHEGDRWVITQRLVIELR